MSLVLDLSHFITSRGDIVRASIIQVPLFLTDYVRQSKEDHRKSKHSRSFVKVNILNAKLLVSHNDGLVNKLLDHIRKYLHQME